MTDTNQSRGRQAEFDKHLKRIKEFHDKKMNALKIIYPDLWKKHFTFKKRNMGEGE